MVPAIRPDHQHGEPLVDVVVKISGNTSTFFFLYREGGERLDHAVLSTGGECLLAGAKKSFRFDMTGNFLQQRLIHIGQFFVRASTRASNSSLAWRNCISACCRC